MHSSIRFTSLLLLLISTAGHAAEKPKVVPPIEIGAYEQQVPAFFTPHEGLPSMNVLSVAVADGKAYAGTAAGLVRMEGLRWVPVEGLESDSIRFLAVRGSDLYALIPGGIKRLDREGEVVTIAKWGSEWLVGERPLCFAVSPSGPERFLAGTDDGLFEAKDGDLVAVSALNDLMGEQSRVRAIAISAEYRIAVAAEGGLFLSEEDDAWQRLFPQDEGRSWAPVDVRGVCFEPTGELWFASPQGAGRLDRRGKRWNLFTGQEGLPYQDFTCVASARAGEVWFGTRMGAIRHQGDVWEYRNGRMWLPDDEVRGIAVDAKGNAWFATDTGAAMIERQKTTLAEKARLFENEIDKYHRRTPYGYVDAVTLFRSGEKEGFRQHDSDNDGLWTAMYGTGECFAYAATGDPLAKERAKKAFDALKFLSDVTQGGSHGAPKGFPARSILPTNGRDPNVGAAHRDRTQKESRDALWKIIPQRWPVSEDGQWYWKSDTSSDELDGHFLFYGVYYDLVADTEEEKERVRGVVGAIVDHLVAHDFSLVDHDGHPTRWAQFGPDHLNHKQEWWAERGLNSLSILAYLRVAEHVTGDVKYGKEAERLIEEHGYAANVMYPKVHAGPATGNQSDDEMAFMGYYNLLKYEKDPKLRQMWLTSFYLYWKLEEPEVNPFFNFAFVASCHLEQIGDAFGRARIRLDDDWLVDSLDALQRYPLDRITWGFKNSHRKDILLLNPEGAGKGARARGSARNGKTLPIDERFVDHWNLDPWELDGKGGGKRLADGASFLLPYYMGLYHKFLIEKKD